MKSIVATACFLVADAAMAGWFGPSSYEDCVLENMKGVTSDTAAVAISRACSAKFPAPPTPPTPQPPTPTKEEMERQRKLNEECWRRFDEEMAKYERAKKSWGQRYFNGVYMPYPGMKPSSSCGGERS